MDDNGHDEGSQVQEVMWELIFCGCVRLSKARSYQFEWILDTHQIDRVGSHRNE